MLTNKTLLITGGTGSFGNAVLERFLDTGVKEIRIFSRDEKKQDDMRQHYHNDKIKYYIGDVRDSRSIDMAMPGVDYVFHAAALKQVPSCEFFPLEAVRTNVIGCDNVLESAIRAGVKKVIVLSTDKAVYPINAMGLSKALSEKVMVARSRTLIPGTGKSSPPGRGQGEGLDGQGEVLDGQGEGLDGTVLCGTRYGNVMASRGSVIPLLVDQIKSGKPLTLTDPDMTRFMMTLAEAVDLVLYAYEHGHNGDIFVQKAPACTIRMLAEALLQLYGAKNEIRIIGTRHGEKKYETLVNREEMVKAEDLGQYFRIPADTRDLNYGKYFSEGASGLSSIGEYNSDNTHQLTLEETKELLLRLELH